MSLALVAVMSQIAADGGDLLGAPVEPSPRTDPRRLYRIVRLVSRGIRSATLRQYAAPFEIREVWCSEERAAVFRGGAALDAATADLRGVELVEANDAAAVEPSDPFALAAVLRAYDARHPGLVPPPRVEVTSAERLYQIRNRSDLWWLQGFRSRTGKVSRWPWTHSRYYGSVFTGGPALDRALRGRDVEAIELPADLRVWDRTPVDIVQALKRVRSAR